MKSLLRPAQTVALGFLLAITVGTCALMLPTSSSQGEVTHWITALFTSVSAVCVTGLAVVDTGTHWSTFGQWVILILFQVGGFGIMTFATLLGLMVNRSLQLRMKMITQAEKNAISLGDIKGVAKLILLITLIVEIGLTIILTIRFQAHYDMDWPQALWNGFFHAVSAFNNAGFSLHSDSLVRYAGDFWIISPIMFAIIVGGLGFPVLHDLKTKFNDPRHWSLHTKLTLIGTAALLLAGFIGTLLFEWNNAGTLGNMNLHDKLAAASFASVTARTAGFNSIDTSVMTQASLALNYLLMFIGGGSGGTAGGVKVGTFLILVLMVWSEIKGRSDTEAFGRRISLNAQRQAITVLMLSSTSIVVGTTIILFGSNLPMDKVIFEVISAFATVGLSTGITADLPASGKLTLITLMYIGRVGTITLAASLALDQRYRPYRYAEEHPIVG